MMLFELSRERRARVWLDNIPSVIVPVLGTETRHAERSGQVAVLRRAVAVELFAHVGPRIVTGLLGATADDGSTSAGQFAVRVNVTSAEGRPFGDSLAGALDEMRWGLPAEYAGAVLDGALEAVAADGAPNVAGLRFGCAAHGHIGSSRSHFARLAKLVMKLFVTSNDERELRALLEGA